MNHAHLLDEAAAIQRALDRLVGCIREASAAPAAPASEPTRLTVEQYAAQMSVTSSTVRRWISRGMPVRRVGKRVIRIDPAVANAWSPEDAATPDDDAIEESARRAAARPDR